MLENPAPIDKDMPFLYDRIVCAESIRAWMRRRPLVAPNPYLQEGTDVEDSQSSHHHGKRL